MKVDSLPACTIGLTLPEDVARRVLLHLEEGGEGGPLAGRVEFVQAGRWEEFPPVVGERYLRIVPNHSRPYPGFDYLRYGGVCRSIWQPTPSSFLIESNLLVDEGAVLDCIRDLWTTLESSASIVRMHASVVRIGNGALLIVGPCRSGKTTLVVRLLAEVTGATLVADGVCLLLSDSGGLLAHYWPRPIYIRFATLFASAQLENAFLPDLSRCEATQTLDGATIARILRKRNPDLDLGLTMARRRFCEALGVAAEPMANISRILFVGWSESGAPQLTNLMASEARERLRVNEFPQAPMFGRIERQPYIVPPPRSAIDSSWLRGLDAWSLEFDGWSSLSRALLEDLAS